SSRRRHTRFSRDWSSDVCSSDLSADRTSESSVATLTPSRVPARRGHQLAWAGVAVALTALNLRTAVTGFTPLLETIGADLGYGRSEERRVGKEGRYRWERAQEDA